jgi:hypothetical protein
MTEDLPFTFIGLKDVGNADTALIRKKSAAELRLAHPGSNKSRWTEIAHA